MRKVPSLVLLATVVSAALLPATAQRSRDTQAEPVRAVKKLTSFASIRAVSGSNGVYIEWTMEAETNNLGFFVYKRGKSGQPELLNATRVVAGTGLKWGEDTFFGESYSFYDRNGVPGESYFVESVSMEGRRTKSRAVAAEFPLGLKESSATSFSADGSASLVEAANNRIELRRMSPSRDLGAAIKAGAHSPNIANHISALSQQGVRIGVKKEGFYRVSRQQLEAGGFNGGADPNKWQLYLEGAEQAIIVGPNGDYIEFYGKGVDTPETDTQMYYLIVGSGPGKRIAAQTAQQGAGATVSAGYLQSFLFKERALYVSLLNGPAENYFGSSLPYNTSVDIPVTLTGIDSAGPNAGVEIRLQGANATNHVVEVSVNGNHLGSISFLFVRSFTGTFSVPAAYLKEGVNNFRFKSVGGTSTVQDFNYFDSITVWYPRRYVAENNAFPFYTKNQEKARLKGFSSKNIRIFDVTRADEPALVTGLSSYAEGNSWSVDVPAGAPKLMFAVGDPGLLNDVSVSPISPAVLRTPANEADLIIIAYSDFMPEAEVWANYRRGQGFKVVVADVNDVYDEFDYGKKGPAAIENFLKYAVTNYQTPPEYVLLIGDTTYDPRNYEGKPNNYLVPTRFVNGEFATIPTDEAMADFDRDGLSELAIGRIPARTREDVTVVFNKTSNWESSLANPLNRGALFAHDTYDAANNLDFAAINAEFSNELPVSMPKTHISKTQTDSTTLLINELNEGKYVVNYEGHGLAGSWASTFFNMDRVSNLTNAGDESIFLMLTCFNGAFARVGSNSSNGFDYFDGLAERLVKHSNGGAVAAWSSPDRTTIEVHKVMGKRFFNQLGAGDIDRLGDLIRDAKAALNAGPNIRYGWVLLGDPMLKTQ